MNTQVGCEPGWTHTGGGGHRVRARSSSPDARDWSCAWTFVPASLRSTPAGVWQLPVGRIPACNPPLLPN